METFSAREKNDAIPILVYGATFAGIGIASSSPAEVLLVEPTTLVGNEFIASFHPGKDWEQTLKSEAAEKLRDELITRNLLSESGRVHLPPMAPVLFNFIKQNNLQVKMMTRIVEVKPENNGYHVTLYNASGLQQIRVGSIIDTTSTCSSCSSRDVDIQYRNLNAMLHCDQLETPEIKDESVELVPGLLPGEFILKLKIDTKDGWIEARKKLHHYWMNRPGVLQDWTLAAVADTFEIGVEKGPHYIADNWMWAPSCAHFHLLEAFDAGRLFVEAGELNEAVAAC